MVYLQFDDGTSRVCKLLLAADGCKSKVRQIVCGDKCSLKYSGTQCLMGTSRLAREERGLSLPSSPTSKCHGAFYPVTAKEQCFQFHFPMSEEQAKASQGSWGTLTEHVGQEECNELAQKLVDEGWDKKFLEPLYHVNRAIRIGVSTLDPPLETFGYGQIVLVGDAAHPPVPFLGQGAQQGLEDAGTLALLLKKYCLITNESAESKRNNQRQANTISLTHLDTVLQLYDQMRVPRTREIMEKAKWWGKLQQKRAENPRYNLAKEELIQREIFYHETLPIILPGVQHDYMKDVMNALDEAPLLSVPEEEEAET